MLDFFIEKKYRLFDMVCVFIIAQLLIAGFIMSSVVFTVIAAVVSNSLDTISTKKEQGIGGDGNE